METLKIKKVAESGIIPTRGSDGAAGYDLYAAYSYEIPPQSVCKIETGIAVALPAGTFGAIYARSGLATKQGLRPANCVGVIDEDYRGEVIVALFNDSPQQRKIIAGDRIAQLVVQPYIACDIIETKELDDTNRGAGGFGSTGK